MAQPGYVSCWQSLKRQLVASVSMGVVRATWLAAGQGDWVESPDEEK